MNPVQVFEYGKSRGGSLVPNTFIGGMGSSITNKQSLADKLLISASDISYFNIIGNDIEARININYAIPGSSFNGSIITYYRDEGNKVTTLGGNSFYSCKELVLVKFLAATQVGNGGFGYNNSGTNPIQKLIFPSATIGSTSGNDNVFINGKVRVYAKPELETSNAGAPDGDLQHVLTNGWGGDVMYGYDERKPNTADLAASNIYASQLNLAFTIPNALRYADVFVNGVLHSRIYSLNEAINNLEANTTYQIYLNITDYYYNEGTSNIINVNTLNTYAGEVESQAYIDAVGIVDNNIKKEIKYFVECAQLSNLWSRLLGIYPIIGNTFNQIKYNLKSNSTYTLTQNTAPTIGANVVSGGSMGTGIFPQDLIDQSYHVSFFSKTDTTATSNLIGSTIASQSMIRHLISGRNLINDGYADTGNGRLIQLLPTTIGLLTSERHDVNIQKIFVDGLLKKEDANGNVGTKPNVQFTIASGNVIGCFMVVGNHLTTAQNKELNRLVVRLNTILGR